jgi:hypothetical protein
METNINLCEIKATVKFQRHGIKDIYSIQYRMNSSSLSHSLASFNSKSTGFLDSSYYVKPLPW